MWLSWQFVTAKIHYNQFGVKHSYAGTVTPEEKARRRKANKVAKASRKANR